MKTHRLYYQKPSHYCEKARAILSYKHIPFELVNVPEGDHHEVIEASGQDYVPYLALGDGKGVTWPLIADWAEDKRPEPTIYPGRNVKETRARCRIIEHWAHNVVEDRVWNYVLPDLPKTFKDPRERWVFVELQEAKRGPIEILAHRRPELFGYVAEVCGLSQDLLGNQDFLLGPSPSLADFALYGALHPLKVSGNTIPKQFASLRRWHKRMDASTK
jgi:glutathione S-transferase